MAKRLFDSGYNECTSRTFLLNQLVTDIESSLIMCGATPEKDYTYKDLFGWAIMMLAAGEKDSKEE